MALRIAGWFVTLLAGYVVLGALFAGPFVWRGVERIDPAARGGTWGFRAMIVPGTIALWPWLLARWLRGGPPAAERTAHRPAPGGRR